VWDKRCFHLPDSCRLSVELTFHAKSIGLAGTKTSCVFKSVGADSICRPQSIPLPSPMSNSRPMIVCSDARRLTRVLSFVQVDVYCQRVIQSLMQRSCSALACYQESHQQLTVMHDRVSRFSGYVTGTTVVRARYIGL